MRHSIGLVVGLSLLLGCSPQAEGPAAFAETTTVTTDQILLPAPPGTYRVGTVLRAFTDSSRAEVASFDSSVRRTLYTQI